MMENVTVKAGATWLHARYGNGFLFSGTGVNPAVAGANTNSNPLLTYGNVAQTQDLSGLQMVRAPNFSANAGVDYNIPNGEGGLRFSANLKYTTKYVITNPSVWGPLAPAANQREQRYVEGAYALLNASVTWTAPNGSYYARLWGANLTDHRYRLHWTSSYAPMATPLTFGLTVGAKF